MRVIWKGAVVAVALAGCAGAAQAQPSGQAATDCAALAQTTIPQGGVTSAVMTPGPIPYCQVQLTLTPTPRSKIGVEIWLPDRGHCNGKFLGTGNGGGAGSISVRALRAGLERGYAVANTDMGNPTGDAMNFSFGVGNPDLAEDFGHRSTDLMTIESKRIVSAYYGQAPRYSYFQGCSTGGGQAWEQMERLPGAYDGVVAGSPGNERTYLHMMILVRTALLLPVSGAAIPKHKLAWVQAAVIGQCDALDGVKDGIIADPRRCNFDPASLQCRDGDGPQRLTADQVATLRGLYAGIVNSRTGAQVYPGFEPGAEASFNLDAPPAAADGKIVVRNGLINWSAGYQRAHPDGVGFDFDHDLDLVAADLAPVVNYADPRLAAFRKAGGKLILYQGWADTLVPPQGTVRQYEAMTRLNGGPRRTQSFARLFMVPGMGHCAGGVGPDHFDALAALEAWVEKGEPPERILASRPAKDDRPAMTRPLCAYPKAARWTGKGDPNDAANFICAG